MPRNPNKAVLLFALLLGAFCVGFWAWQPGAIREAVPELPAAALASVPAGPVTDPLVPPDVDAPAEPALGEAQPATSPTPVVLAPDAGATRTGIDAITPVGRRVTRQQTVVFSPQFTTHVIQRGETSFEAISRRVYGTARHAGAIARANPLTSPDKLRAGQSLLIPKDPSNIQGRVGTLEVPAGGASTKPSEPGPAGQTRTHTVAPGETLSDIAVTVYGSSARWREIFEANRDKLSRPERVRAGMVLVIP
jgi:nucleoid-associated protein YgaU